MVIYIPFIYLTIWNFKGCSRSIVTYWLGLSIDFWKFLGELLSSHLTSTRFILKSQQRKCMVFKCPWGSRFPLHHCTAIFYCLNQCVAPCIPASTLGHTDLTSEQNHFVQWEAGPLQSSGPLSPYPIRKKSLFDSVITFSIIPHGNKADMQPISPAIKGHLMSTAVLTPAWQIDL